MGNHQKRQRINGYSKKFKETELRQYMLAPSLRIRRTHWETEAKTFDDGWTEGWRQKQANSSRTKIDADSGRRLWRDRRWTTARGAVGSGDEAASRERTVGGGIREKKKKTYFYFWCTQNRDALKYKSYFLFLFIKP